MIEDNNPTTIIILVLGIVIAISLAILLCRWIKKKQKETFDREYIGENIDESSSLDTDYSNSYDDVAMDITKTDADTNRIVDVILSETGNNKIQVIKIVKQNTGLGLYESKNIADNTPATILKGVEWNFGVAVKSQLENVGATVYIN